MTSKKIDINPALFGMKTRKNRGTKPNLSKIIAPNVNAVKNNLLKKIKEHRLKETKKMEPKKDNVEPRLVDDSYDDFNDSMAYLTTLSQQKKVNDEKANFESNRQKKLENLHNKTLKRHDLPPVYLELPENLNNFTPKRPTLPLEKCEDIVPLVTETKPPLQLVRDPIPYGNLKNGTKPTYKEWTRRNINPVQPVVISGEMISKQDSERETQLNLIKAKLKQKQENVNNTQLNKRTQPTLMPPLMPPPTIQEVVHHRTIRRKHLVGKLKKNRSVGILLVDRDTRKQIMGACKELKRKPMVEVKQYLREHNFIKIGSTAPNDVLRQMYESAVLSGEVRNNNVDVLMHNFIKGDEIGSSSQ